MRPLFRTFFFAASFPRPASRVLWTLLACLALLLTASAAFAQSQPFYAGTSATVYGTSQIQAYSGTQGDWWVGGSDNTNPNGWGVGIAPGGGLNVKAPSTAPVGSYSANYVVRFYRHTLVAGEPTDYYVIASANFQGSTRFSVGQCVI